MRGFPSAEEPLRWLRVIQEAPLNVMYPEFGVVGDGVADDAAGFQAWADKLGTVHPTDGADGYIPPLTYRLASPVILPGASGSTQVSRHFFIQSRGATLNADHAGPIFTRNFPADMAEAGLMAKDRFTFYGIRFVGTSAAGQMGVQIPCSYGSVLRECAFRFLDFGADLIFCLMAEIAECMGSRNVSNFIRLRSGNGLWAGATVAGTPCNGTLIQECRDDCVTGQLASFLIQGSSDVTLRKVICEGQNPVESVRFEHQTNGSNFHIDGIWLEHVPSGVACIHAPASGQVIIEKIHMGSGLAGKTIVNGDGGGSGSFMRIKNIPFWPAGALMRHSTVDAFQEVWVFDNIGTPGVDMTQAAQWDVSAGGFAPNLVTQYPSIDSAVMGANYPLVKSRRYGIQAIDDIRLLATTGVRLGTSTAAPIKNYLSAVLAQDLGNIVDGAFANFNMTVTGAAVGDPAFASFASGAMPAGVWLDAHVTAADTVRVTMHNESGAAYDPPNGNYRAVVIKH